MTAVFGVAAGGTLAGVTPLAFVRGEVTIEPTALTPLDWVQLIDDAMMGVSWGDIGYMMPVGELLTRRYAGPGDPEVRSQSVTPAVLKKAFGGVPPGTRFMHISRLPRPANPMHSADLLFGPNPEKDAKRKWKLYTLEVNWRLARKQELGGCDTKGFAVKQIAIYSMPTLQTLELFEKQDVDSVYLVGRDVLHRLYQALSCSIYKQEKHLEHLREREAYVARMLGRANFGPFAATNQL